MNNLFCTILLVFIYVSCTKSTDNKLFVEVELLDYFESFKDEAAKREVIINLESEEISGFIENFSKNGVVGNCTRYQSGKKEIRIDKAYWMSASDYEKEFIVFHELGHCILGRDHIEDGNGTGQCVSIMASGKGDCRIKYNFNNRDAYLDELFK